MDTQKFSSQEYQISSNYVIAKIKELLHEGNIRRIRLKHLDGKILFDVPLTLGIAGVLLAPGWLAMGALALLTPNLTIVVEKVDPPA